MSKVPTAHIQAKVGDFAKIVLMPGDPLRAKFIAENYLKDVKQVNAVRGMLAFTGTYNGTKISVMGHGMGIPSIGIYSYELFAFYGVETIIRVGSCGAYLPELELGSVILGKTSISYSTFAEAMNVKVNNHMIDADHSLTELAIKTANELAIKVTPGLILSSDVFYGDTNGATIDAMIKNNQILAVEMEAYALYVNAQKLKKQALTILTVSDSFVTHQEMSAEERQKGFTKMIKLALELAHKKEGHNA